jgi:hypothetical protein
MRFAPVWLLSLVCLVLCGCGSEGLVSVSGTVTMDGKPLAGASIIFQPVNAGGADATWGEAYAKTSSDGRYSLSQVLNDKRGVGPGKYRVSIVSGTAPIPDPLSDASPPPGTTEPIPARYNAHSELSFDVPPSGTDQADFKLTSNPAPAAQTRRLK